MKLTDLREILQYIPRFREKIFVISIDGEIVTSENFANILLDVAVLRSLNIRVALAHGAPALGGGLRGQPGASHSLFAPGGQIQPCGITGMVRYPDVFGTYGGGQ